MVWGEFDPLIVNPDLNWEGEAHFISARCYEASCCKYSRTECCCFPARDWACWITPSPLQKRSIPFCWIADGVSKPANKVKRCYKADQNYNHWIGRWCVSTLNLINLPMPLSRSFQPTWRRYVDSFNSVTKEDFFTATWWPAKACKHCRSWNWSAINFGKFLRQRGMLHPGALIYRKLWYIYHKK